MICDKYANTYTNMRYMIYKIYTILDIICNIQYITYHVLYRVIIFLWIRIHDSPAAAPSAAPTSERLE